MAQKRNPRGTHAEGSILGSLEFCTGALNTRLIFVLGHTACGALKGATAAYLSQGEKKANHALDVLLNELGTVVSEAQSQCGKKATADEIANKAAALGLSPGFPGVVGSSWSAEDVGVRWKIAACKILSDCNIVIIINPGSGCFLVHICCSMFLQ